MHSFHIECIVEVQPFSKLPLSTFSVENGVCVDVGTQQAIESTFSVGRYKSWNGMEPKVVGAQYGRGCRIRDEKLVLICQVIYVRRADLASCTCHEDGTSSQQTV